MVEAGRPVDYAGGGWVELVGASTFARSGSAAEISRAKERTAIARSVRGWVTADRNRFRVGIALIAAVGLVWRIVYARWYVDVAILSDGYHYMVSAAGIAD